MYIKGEASLPPPDLFNSCIGKLRTKEVAEVVDCCHDLVAVVVHYHGTLVCKNTHKDRGSNDTNRSNLEMLVKISAVELTNNKPGIVGLLNSIAQKVQHPENSSNAEDFRTNCIDLGAVCNGSFSQLHSSFNSIQSRNSKSHFLWWREGM